VARAAPGLHGVAIQCVRARQRRALGGAPGSQTVQDSVEIVRVVHAARSLDALF
jgi:hypothetical protein